MTSLTACNGGSCNAKGGAVFPPEVAGLAIESPALLDKSAVRPVAPTEESAEAARTVSSGSASMSHSALKGPGEP